VIWIILSKRVELKKLVRQDRRHTSRSDDMTFFKISTYFEKIEGASSRIEMTGEFAKLLSECTPGEVEVVCYLIIGRIAPMFVPIEFNVAEKTLTSILEGVGRLVQPVVDVKGLYAELGDPGLIAERVCEKMQKPRGKKSSIGEIYRRLWEIACVSGIGSSVERSRKITQLLHEISPIEARYVFRILGQKMRVGLSTKTVLDALSVMKTKDKRDRDELERAYGVCSDLGYIARVYKEKGVAGMKNIRPVPGLPIFPMLVEREKNVESVARRIPKAIVQPKYDGLRCQLHVGVDLDRDISDRAWKVQWDRNLRENTSPMLFDDAIGNYVGGVRIYSRNLENMTEMFPDVIKAAQELPMENAILDAEVIGFDSTTDTYLPFQETMTRKRKYGVSGVVSDIPVRVFVFDVMYVDGGDVMSRSYKDRLSIVSKIIPKEGIVCCADNHFAQSAHEIQTVFDDAITKGLEGVVVKDEDSVYRPGARGFEWIKLKRAFQGHLADTVDVVILGYYRGRGRQADFGIGAFLGGVYDAERDEFVSLAKIGTGITDEQWKIIKSDLDEVAVKKKPDSVAVEKRMYPDVWVEPKIVATVEADEITRSPIHTAGRDQSGVGYALRFPRLKVWGRDREAEDATRVSEVTEMYRQSKEK